MTRSRVLRLRAAAAVVLALGAASCGRSRVGATRAEAHAEVGAAREEPPDRLASLHAFEEERRHAADFAHLPASDRALGPDPIAIRAVPGAGPPRFVGVLRGRDAIVLLDGALAEIARAPAPASPTGLAVSEDGVVAVSGEQAPGVALFTIVKDTLQAKETRDLDPRSRGLRDVAVGRAGRVVYAVDERRGTLLARAEGPAPAKIVAACEGPFRVALAGGASGAGSLVVDCLLDHRLLVFDLDRDGMPGGAPRAVIQHDGPLWGFDARETTEGLILAAGGVEDHALDRTEGSFGFIDSFVFLYRVPRDRDGGRPPMPPASGDRAPERIASVNVGEHGVVTPKAIVLRAARAPSSGVTVFAAGYGSDRLAEIAWPSDLAAAPRVTAHTIVPGVAAMVPAGDALVAADPLLDAWLSLPTSGASMPEPVPAVDHGTDARSGLSRVGEAIFFTNLMSPWNHSDGRLSRFTCETCHFEGYVDGRTHHTGRGDVRATTKPLLGLFNNRPHFSRALDPNLTVMVDNEFRAAGAKSDHDPWFSATDTGLAWVPRLGVPLADLDPVGMRRALMAFLMDFTHRPNPAVLGRTSFDDAERRGAAVFARACEGCHEARLVADDASTRQPLARWESLVMTREGPLVWASDGYHATGVTPYVHELGARPPSLRRLYKKRPYFTNGSAKSLDDVLARARVRGDGFWHDAAPADATPLGDADVAALRAFLDLL